MAILSNGVRIRATEIHRMRLASAFARAYVFLASEACSRIATGTVLALDGGSSIRGPGKPMMNEIIAGGQE